MTDDDKKLQAGIDLRTNLRALRSMADALEAEPDCLLYAHELHARAGSLVQNVRDAQ